GDQLFVDLDLSAANLPPGTRLALGTAVIEVTAEPHTGCSKFLERFGPDATMFVNASERRDLHLRGINAKVVTPGRIRVGDRLTHGVSTFCSGVTHGLGGVVLVIVRPAASR